MQLQVPYFEQQTSYTCGPAVLRMATAFLEEPQELENLRNLLDPDPIYGTRNEDMVRTAKKLGFKVYAKSGASIYDIKKFLAKGLPVVVNFIEPRGKNEGHYSLVVGLTKDKIIFNDSSYGEGFELPINEFVSRWHSGFEPYERWMMVVSKQKSRSFFRLPALLGFR